MYHQHFVPSYNHQQGLNSDDRAYTAQPQRSPNAVTAEPSPSSSFTTMNSSPRIKIVNSQPENQYHPRELEIQEFEAEADYKEYILYQRIMQHRNSRSNSNSMNLPSSIYYSNATTSLIPPPALPWKKSDDPINNVESNFLNKVMIQRLRDNAHDRNNSFNNLNYNHNGNDEHEEDHSNYDYYSHCDGEDEELESEEGIFDLDM